MRVSQKCSHSVRFSDTLLFFEKKIRKPFLFWYNKVTITLPRKDGFLMYIYYNRDQLILPMDLEIFIPKHHLCRIVDLAVEKKIGRAHV